MLETSGGRLGPYLSTLHRGRETDENRRESCQAEATVGKGQAQGLALPSLAFGPLLLCSVPPPQLFLTRVSPGILAHLLLPLPPQCNARALWSRAQHSQPGRDSRGLLCCRCRAVCVRKGVSFWVRSLCMVWEACLPPHKWLALTPPCSELE